MSQVKKIGEVYKCNICGNIVEVLIVGGGELVCCGAPMELKVENTEDAVKEKPADTKVMADKHIPVVEMVGDKVLVKIGSVEHPMTAEHHIEWVEIITKARVYRKTFTPGEKPFAEFNIGEEVIETRAYCNLHGLWKS